MSYEILTEKLKIIPQNYLNEISDFINYIYLKSQKEQIKNNNITSKINEVCNKPEYNQEVLCTGLESVRELTKNDAW